jgi:EpsD family peptidyl-prolyl cis-trans isomerase
MDRSGAPPQHQHVRKCKPCGQFFFTCDNFQPLHIDQQMPIRHEDTVNHIHFRKSLLSTAAIVALTLAGCHKTGAEHKPGQALASVNGQEITVLQLNEEMQRANVQPAQQDAARKQLLQVLVDRQLLASEAEKEKLDRDPMVVQAIERAKSLIVAQAYLQKHIGSVAKPTRAEVEAYYQKHPEFFAQRKQFVLNEVLVAGADMNDRIKSAAEAAKTLDELTAYLDAQHVKYSRAQVLRATSDMAPELTARIAAQPRGQLFVVKEPKQSLFLSVADVRESPLALDTAAPQIEQFLFNKKNKDAAEAELARLRASAKIDYLNGQTAPAAAPAATTADAGTAQGVAGLK